MTVQPATSGVLLTLGLAPLSAATCSGES